MNDLRTNIGKMMLWDDLEIQVRNSGIFRFPSAYRFENHNHKEYEINYVNNGSCIMGINGMLVPLKRGDCIIVYPGALHQFIVDTRGNCRITQLEFTAKVPEGTEKQLHFFRTGASYRKVTDCESTCSYMENICRIFRTEQEDMFQETLLQLGFFQLFIDISEKIANSCEHRKRRGKAGKIDEIISYINEKCDKELNLEILAERFGVSSRYIRKCFQEETGMNCQKYICTLRISKAKELLWFTSKTATEIALETGFGSSQYFCRVFQQYTEMTPMEYRNLWQGQKAEELCKIDYNGPWDYDEIE